MTLKLKLFITFKFINGIEIQVFIFIFLCVEEKKKNSTRIDTKCSALRPTVCSDYGIREDVGDAAHVFAARDSDVPVFTPSAAPRVFHNPIVSFLYAGTVTHNEYGVVRIVTFLRAFGIVKHTTIVVLKILACVDVDGYRPDFGYEFRQDFFVTRVNLSDICDVNARVLGLVSAMDTALNEELRERVN